MVSPGKGGKTYSIAAEPKSAASPRGWSRSEANAMSHSMIESTTLPPRLRPGDTVGIPAPASPVPADRLRAGIDRLGGRYRIRVADDVARATGYLAGSDERRADE